MPRARTGTVERHGDHWDAKILLADGKTRERFCLEPGMSKDAARAEAAALSRRALEVGAEAPPAGTAPEPEGERVSKYAGRWLKERDARGLTSVGDDRGRLEKHVLPLLSDRATVAVTRTDVERVVEDLDRKVRAGEISWKTAHNVWGNVTRMFADACASKSLALRVRADDPCADVRGPDRGASKAKVYLYPSEFLALVNHERAPLRWRRLFALAVYLYARAGEIEAMGCDDIDLSHASVHVHRTIDRSREVEKELKGKEARRFSIEPELMPLLRALHLEAGGRGRLVKFPPVEDLCEYLRKYLGQVIDQGGARRELLANDRTRKHLTFHDLRATGITWMAVRGDDALRIQHRAGHKDLSTTQGYIREAENAGQGFGTPFPPLPPALYSCDSSDESSEQKVESAEVARTPALSSSDPNGIRTRFRDRGARKVPVVSRPASPETTSEHVPERPSDDSRTIQPGPRAVLVGVLTDSIRALTEAGDLSGARVALEALTALLAGPTGTPAAVVDLAERRGKGRGA